MRQIDNMTSSEIDALKLKGMTADQRDNIRFGLQCADGQKPYGMKHIKGDAWAHYDFRQYYARIPGGERTGGANDHCEEQQHEASHFVPEDGETDAERNL